MLRWNGGGSSGGWACVCAAQPGVSCGVCQKCRDTRSKATKCSGCVEYCEVQRSPPRVGRWGGHEVLCPLPATQHSAGCGVQVRSREPRGRWSWMRWEQHALRTPSSLLPHLRGAVRGGAWPWPWAAHPREAIDTGRRLAAKLLCTFLPTPRLTPRLQLCTAAAGLERATHRASPGALAPHREPTWSIEPSIPAYRNHETGLPLVRSARSAPS